MAARDQILRWKCPENARILSLFSKNRVKMAEATWHEKTIIPVYNETF